MAKAISQSDTMWVKKGDKLPDGSIAKRGVLWDTKNKKRVTGAVKLVEATKRGKAGETLSVKAGRYSKPGSLKKPGSPPQTEKTLTDALSRRMSQSPAKLSPRKPAQAASSGYQAGSPASNYKPSGTPTKRQEINIGRVGPGAGYGTPAQQKVRNLTNQIAAKKAAIAQNKAKAATSAAARAQQAADEARLKVLEAQLKGLK
jgi:hypothetical protein